MPDSDREFQRFLAHVWKHDVAPLLKDARRRQRQRTASTTGKAGAAGGLLLDGVLGLKGRPFTRFLTVVGATLGAILPDVLDWKVVALLTDDEQRRIESATAQRAAALQFDAALALFGLTQDATSDDLKRAWREASLRWHPDRAGDDQAQRAEHHMRFVACSAAYDRLTQAYARGELPRPRG